MASESDHTVEPARAELAWGVAGMAERIKRAIESDEPVPLSQAYWEALHRLILEIPE